MNKMVTQGEEYSRHGPLYLISVKISLFKLNICDIDFGNVSGCMTKVRKISLLTLLK